MKKTSVYLVAVGLLFSCGQQTKSNETGDTLKTSAAATIISDTTANPTTEIEENDCVFNNDYKGLTTE